MTETNTAGALRWDQDPDGIVVLTLDDPTSSANTMNDLYKESMGEAIDRLEAEKDDITGVVVTSAKTSFFAGGNLKRMLEAGPDDAPQVFAMAEAIKAQLRRLETLGKPVVAAVNGTALGGGLEITLACHHRIVVDDPTVDLGVPEVTLGLLPGGGGVTRLVRMLGLSSALMDVLLTGKRFKPAEAKEKGLVDELVPTREELLPAAKAWVRANTGNAEATTQPWDRPGYKMPGGTPSHPKLAAILPAFPANLRKQSKGADYPAPRAIMSAAIEGAQVDFDTASRIESRYLTRLIVGQNAKNMIQAFFFDMATINSGVLRPDGVPQFTATKLGVLGAGMMGAGIAYSAARSGIEVVLKDVVQENAEKGKGYAADILDKAISRAKMTEQKKKEILARITPTDNAEDLKGCDLVIEAVFEDPSLKHKVFGEVQDIVNGDALLASNTSTLPITGLAEGVRRPEDFIGMHFFSPVDKMPLVEIIKGAKTSSATVARAIDVVQQLKKTPIVVNDSRGFYTSRVYGTLITEGVALLEDGVDPQTIERAATMAGFPAPPLAMLDEVSLTLSQSIRRAAVDAAVRESKELPVQPGADTIDRMVDEFARLGKAAGSGFYDYPAGDAGGKKHLWPGLREHFSRDRVAIPIEDIAERYLFAMALETAKCFSEGVIESSAAANIGSIFGIGFPPLHGGTVQFMEGYDGGLVGFVARARELASRYGERFQPPAYLVEKAAKGESF
ncbi:MAG TPA: 3-hydroxyacyl-CoA dehydrogenase NAD-binding domain-containing protein [Nocardioidaceae bacterium]|nr:3-hydroxyacyl-CoA dehydrogenase NAD-binding domain-containing protein [Nocardioidaceae bacterium]